MSSARTSNGGSPKAGWIAVGTICLAAATTTHAGAIARSSGEIEFHIDAQPVERALQEFALQARLQLIYQSVNVSAGVISQHVDRVCSADAALSQLLAHTNLNYKFVNERTVAIWPNDVDVAAQAPVGSWQGTVMSAAEAKISVAEAAAGNVPTTPREQNNDSTSSVNNSPEEVLVSAQRREERLQTVPISISVLGGPELDRTPLMGITETLNTVPGVSAFPYNQGGGTLVAVRGVTASAPIFAGPSPIGYYLDGMPFGLVDTAIAPDASAYDMERVEVLRGPQGTLYGASALNGVVRILTKDADLNNMSIKIRGSDSETDGGGNNYRGDMALNAPIIPGVLAARAVLGYEDLSGWIDKSSTTNANDGVLRNARLKINSQPTENLSVGLSAWLSRQDYGAPSTADNQSRSNHLLVSEPSYTHYGVYGLRLGYEFGEFSVTSMSSYLNYASRDIFDFGTEFLGFSYPLDENFGAHVFSEEVDVNSTLSGPWKWTAGAIYRDGTNVTSQTLPAIVTLNWTDTSRSYAVFGELTRQFFQKKLELTVGGRYFHDDVTTREDPASTGAVPGYYAAAPFHSTTPRVVLAWHPAELSTVYGSYSEGFRSGAPQPYYITNGVSGLPSVQPDKLHNYELGAKTDLFDRHISVDAAIYYMQWRNAQQQLSVPFLNTFVAALVNGKSASGPGVDIGLTARPVDKLSLGINFSWNDLTFDSDVISAGSVLFKKGDRLNYSAKYTAGALATYTVALGNGGYEGRLSASANYASPLSDHGLVGAAVERTVSGNSMLVSRAAFAIRAPTNWEATVFVDNISNDRGALARNPQSLNPDTGVRGRPRTAGIQFDYQY